MPLSDVINLSISLDSPAVGQQGFGTELMLSHQTTIPVGEIRTYTDTAPMLADSTAGITDTSHVYLAAQKAFAQSPRPDRVAVGSIAALVAQVVNVEVTVNGDVELDVTMADRTETIFVAAGVSASDTRDALVAAFTGFALPLGAASGAGDSLDVTADNAGEAFAIASGAGTTATIVIATSVENVGPEDGYAAIVDRRSWYGVSFPGSTSYQSFQLAVAVEPNRKIHGCTLLNDDDVYSPSETEDVLSAMKGRSLVRTVAVVSKASGADYAGEALLANRLAVNPDESSTIWAFVTLPSVAVGDDDDTEQATIESKGGNHYNLFEDSGIGATYPGQTPSGQKPDLVTTADWLYFRLVERYQAIFLNASNRGSKVPYTGPGIAVFDSATSAQLDLGEQIDHLEVGSSVVNMPNIEDVSPADRAARVLRFTFSAVPAGAIEGVSINGFVSLSL